MSGYAQTEHLRIKQLLWVFDPWPHVTSMKALPNVMVITVIGHEMEGNKQSTHT